MPGSEFFEAMMDFAATSAGSRGRWWRQMGDAARYARRDFECEPYYDPCYDPYYDSCAWPGSHCDPCEPPRSWCAPCPPPYEECDPCDDPCQINLKEVKEWLAQAKNERLRNLSEGEERTKEEAKLEGWMDSIIHSIKASRAAEAMRRKQWSRSSGRRW